MRGSRRGIERLSKLKYGFLFVGGAEIDRVICSRLRTQIQP